VADLVESWSTQQLAEFLAFVSSFTDEQSAMRGAVERAAEVLDAEAAALVRGGSVETHIGFGVAQVPEDELMAVSRGTSDSVEIPGLGSCVAAAAALEDAQHGQLILARHDDDEFSQEESDLLRGMARVLALALEMLRALEHERALRKRSEHEIGERRSAEHQLAHQTTHDGLTGLPNRTLLRDRVGHALERSQRDSSTVAVLFLDIDNFKAVNESLGHPMGDQLLVQVAGRLGEKLRSSDTKARLGGQTLSCWGGDEFVVLCEDLNSERDAIRVTERIAAALYPPFTLEGNELSITVSIGIAVTSAGGSTRDALIRDADAAMHRAKERGRDRYELFDQELRTRMLDRLHTERELGRAIERDELRLFYQPIVSVADGHVAGVEGLIRWQHPQRGLLSPADFIPLAEESKLIVPVGTWVLEQACHQSARWRETHPDWPPLRVAVNLSARQLTDELPAIISSALLRTGAHATRLTLELTETLLMETGHSATGILAALRELGVQIALDDFGTGYSSLSYLQRFPLDVLKLDRSFISGLGREPSAAKIVAATIDMARALGMSVVAEGVETAQQLQYLRDFACHFAQGYHLARPQPPEAIAALLEKRPAGRRQQEQLVP
jgi:diguanylate cyclase (GGDEF)-like protein